jgi:hypothetical protein
MKTLYQTLEQLALELPTYGDIAQTARAVALIFHDEILYLPWNKRHAVADKLRDPRSVQHLITIVLREMQRHARAILLEQGCGIFEEGEAHPTSPFPEEHAAIVQRVWDGLGQAPAWLAFESQIAKLVNRYKEED